MQIGICYEGENGLEGKARFWLNILCVYYTKSVWKFKIGRGIGRWTGKGIYVRRPHLGLGTDYKPLCIHSP